jgi:hypothetical protein
MLGNVVAAKEKEIWGNCSLGGNSFLFKLIGNLLD